MRTHERSSQEFTLQLRSDLQAIEDTVADLVRCCEAFAFGGSRLYLNFRVGVSEALTNAIRHGNRSDPEKEVRVEVELDESHVALTVIDQGDGFDPDALPDPTLPNNLQRPGGRGVFLMRNLMDEVKFIGPGNAVWLVLYRNPPRSQASTE